MHRVAGTHPLSLPLHRDMFQGKELRVIRISLTALQLNIVAQMVV